MHTTNYIDAFIAVAEDCPVTASRIPPDREPKSIARRTWEMLIETPYQYTSDDVLYTVQGQPKGVSREEFFSKPQPCFRASPLTKQYGWGIHADGQGKIALIAMESKEYAHLLADKNLSQKKAMRSARQR